MRRTRIIIPLSHCQQQQLRHQSTSSESSSRDGKKYQHMHDFHSGDQQTFINAETDSLTDYLHGKNNRQKVTFADRQAEVGNKMSDYEKDQRMAQKFSDNGPGEKLKKSLAESTRDELQLAQDIDGLPWEVRWRKTMVPTQEEVVQDMRDRFELWYDDPMQREEEWFLNWRDKMYKTAPDRRIWPQGYTDYLDLYDEDGRRKFLPSDKKWSAGHKFMIDQEAQKRLWMADAEERKATMLALTSDPKTLALELEQKTSEQMDTVIASQWGVIDLNPEKVLEVLAGTAEPRTVAETKQKLHAYAAEQTMKSLSGQEPGELDPVSGMPKARDRELLPSGLTIEQAAFLESKVQIKEEEANQKAEAAMMSGTRDSGQAFRSEQLKFARETGQDRPHASALLQENISKMKKMNQQLLDRENNNNNSIDKDQQEQLLVNEQAEKLLDAVVDDDPNNNNNEFRIQKIEEDTRRKALELEQQAKASEKRKSTAAATTFSSNKTTLSSSSSSSPGFIDTSNAVRTDATREEDSSFQMVVDYANASPDVAESTADERGGDPEWYQQNIVGKRPMIETYGLTNDPLEKQPIKKEFMKRPQFDSTKLVENDDLTMPTSAFDEKRVAKEAYDPQLASGEYKPLPTFASVDASKSKYLDENNSNNAEEASSSSLATSAQQQRSQMLREMKIAKKRAASSNATTNNNTLQSQARNSRNNKKRTASEAAVAAHDQDLMLPDLPWEGDSVSDPSRGVAKVSRPFDKKVLRDAFRVYREFVQQHVASMASMNGQVAEANIERYLRDGIEKAKRGDVGNLPDGLEKDFNDILKIVFEGHMIQVLTEFLSNRGAGRKPEVDALKAQTEDLMRKATAKTKLMGQDFVDFMQQLTAEEMEAVKKSPYQRHVIMVKDKAHINVIKPFTNWMAQDLQPIVYTNFKSLEELDRVYQVALKAVEGHRRKLAPTWDTKKVSQEVAEQLADCAFAWCKAALCFHVCRKYFELFLQFTDTRIRSKAEDLAEDSFELFNNRYYPLSTHCGLQIPIPHTDPVLCLNDSDFLNGEDGQRVELSGQLQKAEEIYKLGVRFRWYGEFDETEYCYFLERRGRYSQALEASDRCLQAMNKKTHPSVYPFPTKAAADWLEGAPLSQETAEHLWMRNMGDLHFEHADLSIRMGRYQTARELRARGLGFYKMGLKLVHEKDLPSTWRAPLLTQARMLCNSDVPPEQAREQLTLVEKTIDDICALDDQHFQQQRELTMNNNSNENNNNSSSSSSSTALPITSHWIDRGSMIHINAALIFAVLPHYHKVIMDEAQQLAGQSELLSAQQSIEEMKKKAKENVYSDKMRRIIEAVDVTAGNFRRRMITLRDRERDECDMWHVYNLLRFWVRVSPKTPEKVDRLWKEFEPTYEYFYLQTAVGNTSRSKFFADVLRRMSFILLAPGSTDAHKKLLLEKMTQVKERMRTAVAQPEIDRTLTSLETYFEMKQKQQQQQKASSSSSSTTTTNTAVNNIAIPPPYCYGDSTLVQRAERSQLMFHNNPLLSVKLGDNERDYAKFKEDSFLRRDRDMQTREQQAAVQSTVGNNRTGSSHDGGPMNQ